MKENNHLLVLIGALTIVVAAVGVVFTVVSKLKKKNLCCCEVCETIDEVRTDECWAEERA